MEFVFLTLLLSLVYLVLVLRKQYRRRNVILTDRLQPPKVHKNKESVRPRFSRTPRRGSHAHKVAIDPKNHDLRPQKQRILDLHLRGAIFCVTRQPSIEGYDCTPLGTVRIDAGASIETRLARAAGLQFPTANALINLRELPLDPASLKRTANSKTSKWHEWQCDAVNALPHDPALWAPDYQTNVVLIDGSNVINWYVDADFEAKPSLAPLLSVLLILQARGQTAGVIFDATVGHRLMDRFVGHDELARLLPLAADVLVVEKGTIADTVLIEMARSEAMIIISNDHFRDHPKARHLLKQKGYASTQGITLLEPRT